MKKKLIEVALPLDAINAASAREKSIRHGHPSTLHLWWARRPLATARAVIWSSLVDDPSAHPEEFPTEEDQDRERQRLFGILEQLVVWENSNNEDVLEAAKAEIRRSCGNDLPPLLDPFAGGGSIPLEAQRLGLEAIAHDLNPVAVLINKAEIEIPPRFAGMPPVNPEARKKRIQSEWPGSTGLAADVEYYGTMLRDLAFEKIGHLYPKVDVPAAQGGGEATVIAWLWARTVRCPNPACGHEAPLVRSFDLSKKKGKEWHVEPIAHDGELDFEVKPGLSDRKGTIDRRGAICVHCGEPIGLPYIRSEGQAGRMGERLMAIVAEGKRGRAFVSPDEAQRKVANCNRPTDYPKGKLPEKALGFRVQGYGFKEYTDLFTNRQLTMLTTFSSLLDEIRERAEEDAYAAGLADDGKGLAYGDSGARGYAEAVIVYLSLVLSKGLNLWSNLTSWMSDRGALREVFSRQAIPMVWDYAEANPFSNSGGSFNQTVHRCCDVLLELHSEKVIPGTVQQFAAQEPEEASSCFVVSTDPPYYDNIGYADLSDFFYIWLRLSLKDVYTKLFKTILVPKSEELIATPYRFKGDRVEAKQFFESEMTIALSNINRIAVTDIPITVYYAYKQEDSSATGLASTGWETMLTAIMRAGFEITGTWPMRTEGQGRLLSKGTNALASSIVIVCRKHPEDAPITTRRDFVRALRRTMGPALKTLQNSHIAPVDFAQAAIGPGMEVFSKYSQVLEANGQTMGVRAALELINDELDRHLSDQSDDFGREARLCVDLYDQTGWDDLEYGDADVLARAKNGSIQALVGEGSAASGRGLVHLVRREDLPKSLPSVSSEWLKAQFLVRELDTGGVDACAKALASFSVVDAEHARNLAYRLFSIADAHGWTKDANAYNSLVISWQDIALRAEEYRNGGGEQLSFDIDGE